MTNRIWHGKCFDHRDVADALVQRATTINQEEANFLTMTYIQTALRALVKPLTHGKKSPWSSPDSFCYMDSQYAVHVNWRSSSIGTSIWHWCPTSVCHWRSYMDLVPRPKEKPSFSAHSFHLQGICSSTTFHCLQKLAECAQSLEAMEWSKIFGKHGSITEKSPCGPKNTSAAQTCRPPRCCPPMRISYHFAASKVKLQTAVFHERCAKDSMSRLSGYHLAISAQTPKMLCGLDYRWPVLNCLLHHALQGVI